VKVHSTNSKCFPNCIQNEYGKFVFVSSISAV
jgi:hypothetical protein